ncbi:MAG TPA: tetratricopeptide repeat protein, partial [Candidatus Dormibacteraeota bacterium]|nr:tetratricopeptide repeat protein [Candidatus Dormibacteraeota bacterium]
MTRTLVAIPAAILLLSLSTPAKGQSLVDSPPTAPPKVAPHLPQAQPPSPAQAPAIVVRPDLTDEQMADLYMARKEYREAAQLYKRLADQNPQNAVYLNKLGIAMHQQASLAQALKCYERAVKLDPTYADAQNNIGTIFYQRKKYGKAI